MIFKEFSSKKCHALNNLFSSSVASVVDVMPLNKVLSPNLLNKKSEEEKETFDLVMASKDVFAQVG